MNKKKKILLYALLFIVLYSGQVVQAVVYDRYLDRKLDSFDLNNDGVFSGKELTQEFYKYNTLWAGDVGRNLMPITALFTSLAIIVLVFVGSKVYNYVIKYKKKTDHK